MEKMLIFHKLKLNVINTSFKSKLHLILVSLILSLFGITKGPVSQGDSLLYFCKWKN